MKNTLKIIWSVWLICLFVSCENKRTAADQPKTISVNDKKVSVVVERFDKEFYGKKSFTDRDIAALRNKYGIFFDLWCVRLAGIIPYTKERPSDSIIAANVNMFRQDAYIDSVFTDCEKAFGDTTLFQSEINEAFSRYHVIFPHKKIPSVVFYVSPFTSNVMALDEQLGAGLHFYLGNTYRYYPSLQLPRYMTRKFGKEYLIRDMMKGWIESDAGEDSSHQTMLSEMITAGKVMYALDLVLPETDDTIKTGYTQSQYNWALDNEKKVWAFMVDQQLLYNSNPKIYRKFISDGSTTNGFPKEAPAALGVFIGRQIIRSYMKQHPEVSVEDLFQQKNNQQILSESGYKPGGAL